MEDWVTIKTLRAKNPDMSLREIARLVQASPNTVKTALEREEAPSYQRQDKGNPFLDPFKKLILELITVKHLRGSRVLEEIRSKGYQGGNTAFYAHVRTIKPEARKDFTPYETLPGEQSQFDWSPYSILIAGVITKVIIFSYINGFSRYRILQASLSEDQGAVLEALENGLIASGGVPQRIQTDNAKAFVHNPSRRNFHWNERYLHFCGHYHFEPSRSLPGHPWSKGKVERPFAYIEDHFIAGNSFESFEDLARKLQVFQDKVNAREHATLKTTPDALIAKDREAFSPLPETRYIGIKEEIASYPITAAATASPGCLPASMSGSDSRAVITWRSTPRPTPRSPGTRSHCGKGPSLLRNLTTEPILAPLRPLTASA